MLVSHKDIGTSQSIPIPKSSNSTNNSKIFTEEFSYCERTNSNCFNPSKFSPPNSFLTKLQERINIYSPTQKR